MENIFTKRGVSFSNKCTIISDGSIDAQFVEALC